MTHRLNDSPSDKRNEIGKYVRPRLIEHALCIMHGVINERCSANLEQGLQLGWRSFGVLSIVFVSAIEIYLQNVLVKNPKEPWPFSAFLST